MKTKQRTHDFMWNGDPPDYENRRYCQCGLVETHTSHQVPPRTHDDIATEARILGEHE